MKMRKYTGILLVAILLTAVFSLSVSANDTPPPRTPEPALNVTISSETISGSVNNGLVRQSITLNAGRDGFTGITPDTNVISWFQSLPANHGLTATARAGTANAGIIPTIIIEITGTPGVVLGNNINIHVPLLFIRNSRITAASGATHDVHPDIVAFHIEENNLRGANGATITSLSNATSMAVDDNPNAKWDIKPTIPVNFAVNRFRPDNQGNNIGTLTASAIVNKQPINVSTTATASTTANSTTAIIHVMSGDSVTFTANTTHTRFRSPVWSINGAGDTDPLVRTRIFYETIPDTDPIFVTFNPIYSSYRILKLGFTVFDRGTPTTYDINQIIENTSDKVTINRSDNTANIEAVDMTFGFTPIIIRRDEIDNITVATDWTFDGDDTPKLPSGHVAADPDYRADSLERKFVNVPTNEEATWDLRISTTPNNNNVVRIVNVTNDNLALINDNIARYRAAHSSAAGLQPIKAGDSLIIPQGEGTAAITVTVSRRTASPPVGAPRLDPGTISFNIAVKAAETTVALNNRIITATTDNVFGEKVSVHIDVDAETAWTTATTATPTTIGGRSYNGTAWSSTPAIVFRPDVNSTASTNISGLLNTRGARFMLAERVSGNRPGQDSAVWEIGQINARLATPRLRLFYGNPNPGDNVTIDTDRWTVTGYDFEDTDLPPLLFASSRDGRNPDNPATDNDTVFGFMNFTEADITRTTVRDLPRDGRVTRTPFFFRLGGDVKLEPEVVTAENPQRVIISPASRTVRLQVSSQLRPARIRVDYRREIVRFKAGMAFNIGKEIGENRIFLVDRGTARSGFAFRDEEMPILGASGNTELTYWTAASGNRPRSAETTVIIHNSSNWTGSDTTAVRNGFDRNRRTFRLPRGYEVRQLESTGRWVTSVRNPTGTMELEIRRRGNARFEAKGRPWIRAGTTTASVVQKLTIEFGETGMSGVTVTPLN
jgi:hypothetical protein